ncbi:MAG: hypothetical protein ACI4UM_09550 [Succinivibrio sp.]
MKKRNVILATCVLCAAAVFISNSLPNQAEANDEKSPTMLRLEKAKLAREARKKELEDKRASLEKSYSDKTNNEYQAHVYFEAEMVDSADMNQWVPNGYFAVHFVGTDSEKDVKEKIILINNEKMVSAYVDFTKELKDTDRSTFCSSIVRDVRKEGSQKIVGEVSLITGENSAICQFKTVSADSSLFTFESYELFKDGKVGYVHTLSKNNTPYEDIIKEAFPRAVSAKLKMVVSHSLADFLNTEKYVSSTF